MITEYIPDGARDCAVLIKIFQEELREGKDVWSEMHTKVNGNPETVFACRK